jgi:hypothetical protein
MAGLVELTSNLSIPYGHDNASFTLPKGWHLLSILSPQDLEPVKNLSARAPGESCVLYLFSLVKKRKNIVLVSGGVSPKEAEKMGVIHARSVEEAMKTVMVQKANVYLMPKGSITLPMKGQ